MSGLPLDNHPLLPLSRLKETEEVSRVFYLTFSVGCYCSLGNTVLQLLRPQNKLPPNLVDCNNENIYFAPKSSIFGRDQCGWLIFVPLGSAGKVTRPGVGLSGSSLTNS